MTLRTTLGTLTLCGLLATSGCGSGGSPDGSPSGSRGSSTRPPASSPTSAEPTAEPASGKLLGTTNASVNAPEEWTKPFPMSNADYRVQMDKSGLSGVTISDIGLVGSTADPETELRKVALDDNGKEARTAPIDTDSVLGGELAAHATYEDLGQHHEVYGAFHLQNFVYVDWAFDSAVSSAEQQQVVAEGLASFRWK